MGNSTLNYIIQSDERNCQDWGFASFCESDSLNSERKTGRGEVHRINRTITGAFHCSNCRGLIFGTIIAMEFRKTDVHLRRIAHKMQKKQGVDLNINTGCFLCNVIKCSENRPF